jgi:hypothetical protein
VVVPVFNEEKVIPLFHDRLITLASALPWSFVALYILLGKLGKGAGRERILMCLRDPGRLYLVSWAMFTPLFFTLSGNILWTYVLPALPAFSILLALALDDTLQQRVQLRWAMLCAAVVVPLTASAIFGSWAFQPSTLKTEKFLVAEALAQMKPQDQLAYLGPTPFSATFYSKGRAQSVDEDSLTQQPSGHALYLAVPKEAWESFKEKFGSHILLVTENNRYMLIRWDPPLK